MTRHLITWQLEVDADDAETAVAIAREVLLGFNQRLTLKVETSDSLSLRIPARPMRLGEAHDLDVTWPTLRTGLCRKSGCLEPTVYVADAWTPSRCPLHVSKPGPYD